MKSLKMRKVNIGLEDKPKYTTIGDCWDEDIVSKIKYLLHEYQELFPTKFLDMKYIIGDLGVMRIPLKPDAKPVKQRPYKLNSKYKEKVKEELEKILIAGIIKLVKGYEWVSPMVVQEKKEKGEIRICVDLRKLNDACLHDPFPTPFIDEVLDNVAIKIVDDHFTYIIQFLSIGMVFMDYTTKQKKELVVQVANFLLIAGHLYKMGPDEVLRRYVPEHETQIILMEAHGGVMGGNYAEKATAQKILRVGLWWPIVHKE